MRYDFKIGDKVITTDGVTGKIVDICKCSRCEERGFYEPIWVADDDKEKHERYISIYLVEDGFMGFYQIGEYRFNDFDKAEILKDIADTEEYLKTLKNRLKVMEENERVNEFRRYHDQSGQ